MKRASWLMTAAALVFLTAGTSWADFSESFEQSTGSSSSVDTVYAGGKVGVFTVTKGSVDISSAPYAVEDGKQSLDTLGTGTGVSNIITYTDTNITVGDNYAFVFYFALNTNGRYASTLASVTNGTTALYFVAASTLSTYTGYVREELDFAATSSSATVAFESLSGENNSGILIDNVSLTNSGHGFAPSSVPEPTSMALLAIGAASTLGMVRRRKTA